MRSLAWKARFGAGCAAAAAALGWAGTAGANGRYPAAGLIAFDPSDSQHIVVRATYGLVSTVDGGETWSWICEQAVGFSDNEDPMVVITKDGSVLVGVFDGLSISTDNGCNWSYVGGDLAERYAVDLSVEKGAPERALALTSNGLGDGKFETRVYETSDSGATWQKLGEDSPNDFLGLTIDAAPSDPQRLYVSGRYGAMAGYLGAIRRTVDRGDTWESFDIPGADDKHAPFLSAIDPENPDLLYVRLKNPDVDALLLSGDGGETWTEIFKKEGALLGFALSPDGKKVAVGGDKDGLWIAPADTLAFTKVADMRVKCLLWREEGLYACADEFKDGFHVGFSTNEGKTFTALEHLQQICPLECADGSTMKDKCGIQWGSLAATIKAGPCGGGSSSGGATTTETGGDCSCGIAGGGAAGGALLFGAAAMTAAARRRRRRVNSGR